MIRGLAEYLNFFPCPYPQVVEQWESIPVNQLPQNPGGNGCCCNGGMGDLSLSSISMTAPGGYFGSGADFTQWGVAEWGTVAAGVIASVRVVARGGRVGISTVPRPGKAVIAGVLRACKTGIAS